MRILLVNTQEDFRQTILSQLRSEPEVELIEEVNLCDKGIEKAQALLPDLILLNIDSRDCYNLDALNELRQITPLARLVVVGHDESEEQLLAALRMGAYGYIMGPELKNLFIALCNVRDGEFVLSPKITQMVVSNYSRMRAVVDANLSVYNLTTREQQVLSFLCSGASNREIANHLFITENTVRIHVQNILKKFNLKSRRDIREKYYLALSDWDNHKLEKGSKEKF